MDRVRNAPIHEEGKTYGPTLSVTQWERTSLLVPTHPRPTFLPPLLEEEVVVVVEDDLGEGEGEGEGEGVAI